MNNIVFSESLSDIFFLINFPLMKLEKFNIYSRGNNLSIIIVIIKAYNGLRDIKDKNIYKLNNISTNTIFGICFFKKDFIIIFSSPYPSYE